MRVEDLRAAFDTVPTVWRDVLPGWTAEKQEGLIERLKAISGDRPIGPEDPFRALRLVPPQHAKVVIFGQDPYPTAGHADGLAFSAGYGKPRSLARIFEVLAQDRPGWQPPPIWKLDAWARQGVLLLNPALTVEIGEAGSHLKSGWLALTSEIVQALCQRPEPPVFLLWGGKAQDFLNRAVPPDVRPRVLSTRHPSYDLHKQFMAEGSHFLATRELVDWWAL
ncbi:MAG TPA: uracil-DNA glycosylase [Rhizobacter sp.]